MSIISNVIYYFESVVLGSPELFALCFIFIILGIHMLARTPYKAQIVFLLVVVNGFSNSGRLGGAVSSSIIYISSIFVAVALYFELRRLIL